ncbi:MAG: hypothetical protein J6V44_08205 [Methanobrevibacter sp.]|nr:hypothetical protein [Methanobrevibacter sp.]
MNKYYTIEWSGENPWGGYYSDRRRFEADEKAKMDMFIFDLSRKEGITKIWKSTIEEFDFDY